MVGYLTGGERPTAAKWNELFEAMDELLGRVLNDRTWLTVDGIETVLYPAAADGLGGPTGCEWMGRGFFYTAHGEGPFLYSANLQGQLVAGAVFDALMGSMTYEAPDEVNGWIKVASMDAGMAAQAMDSLRTGRHLVRSVFDVMVEAMTMQPVADGPIYHLWHNGQAEYRHRYTPCELIYEKAAAESSAENRFTILGNKYQFFRIHNLDNAPLYVQFEGGVHPMTVPALGCQCVRRTLDGEYTDGYRYLHRMLPGDPRFYWVPEVMRANNVCNPMGLFELAKVFLETPMFGANREAPYGGWWPRWHVDKGELWDAGEEYEGVFGAAGEAGTVVGDLLTQKGKVVSVTKGEDGKVRKKELEFRGYGTVAEDWEGEGVGVEEE